LKVFISYSTSDLATVRRLAEFVEQHAEVKYWHRDNIPGEGDWATIHGWIDTTNLVVVFITGSVVTRGLAVGKEIGRAESRGKPIIALVGAEVPSSELGVLGGRTYIRLDKENPGAALVKLKESLRAREAQIKSDTFNAILAVGGAILGLWLLSSSK
jgi:hypothetical protein